MILRTLAIALAVTVLALAGTASAQHAGGGGSPDRSADGEPRIDLDFAGGTVFDYLNAVRSAAGGANILIDAQTQLFEMPRVRLQSTAVGAAIELVDDMESIAGGVKRAIDVEVISGTSQRGGGLESSRPGRAIYRTVVIEDERRGTIESRVWSLHNLVDQGVSADSVLAAIEAALELHEEFGQPQLKFHEGTSLLIARAHKAQVQAIAEVIEQLVESRIGDENVRHLQTRQEELLGRLTRAETERAQVTDHLLQMERRSAALQTTLNEVEQQNRDLQAALKEKARNLEVAESAVRALQEELQRVKDGGN